MYMHGTPPTPKDALMPDPKAICIPTRLHYGYSGLYVFSQKRKLFGKLDLLFDVIFAANPSLCLSFNHHSVLKDQNQS